MAREDLEVPRVLYKPHGQYCKVQTEEELDRALAYGWQAEVPKDWQDMTDAPEPQTEPLRDPVGIDVPPVAAKDGKKSKADKAAAKAAAVEGSAPSVLDGTVTEVGEAVANIEDLRELQNLRLQETKGKDRQGALDAIDVRIAELKG